MELGGYVNGVWQEDIVAEAITKLSAGQVSFLSASLILLSGKEEATP